MSIHPLVCPIYCCPNNWLLLLKKLHGENVIFSVLLPKIAVTFKHSELITNEKRDCTMYMYLFLEILLKNVAFH